MMGVLGFVRKAQGTVLIEAIRERDLFTRLIFEYERGISVEHHLGADPLYNAFFPFADKALYFERQLLPELFKRNGNNARLGLRFVHRTIILTYFIV